MVTNNKVLTVSYGTFSCTLEGFDDSFDTMKAIAEYFRDLAADDRYFGAEPPTPDAEMLTRIAEREIERRVQARHESGAIVLSAAPSVAEEETSAEEEPVAEQLQEQPESTAEEVVEDVVAEEEPVSAEEEAAIEAPVEATEVELEAEAPAEETADSAELDVPDVVEAATEAPEADASVIAEPAVEDAAAEFFAASEETETKFEQEDDEEDTVNLFEDAFAEEDEEPAEEDSIAAKLRRIRAVVSRAETSDDNDEGYIEDQHAEETDPIDFDLSDDAVEADASSEEFEAEVEEEVEAVEEAPKPRARVIRMKRAEFEEAVSDGALEEADDADEVAEATEDAPESSLSDEDEADLMAELAMVDAELAEGSDDAIEEIEAVEEVSEAPIEPSPIMDDGEAKREKRRERRAKLGAAQPGEEAVDRLIEEANTKLDEPEGNRRRSAIAHLRAAVAATKAEKEAGKSFEKEDNSEAYRGDLADAVRPRKSQKDAKSAPPLKLVAEQRIDTPTEEKAAGIRPRRVSVDDLAAVEANAASSNFVEFAENMGATQLPEVLEAAASYLTFVEGRKKFSRPMLMRLAYQVGDQRFEREAGLRSFGQLLRDKKIEKIAGGRFTVSDAINFKPDDRAAG